MNVYCFALAKALTSEVGIATFASSQGYTMFDGCQVLQNSVKLDNQVLIDYITQTLGGVIGAEYEDPYGQGRIVITEKEP